ncbi:hypothetical protein V8J36_05390 [Frigidibacter sp. MR17.14]|uniref:hypothetical protein n=1 Tax=Frigidibacter sp. MR17.14 TaxID=3126509 RepID=UPI0030131D70
MKERFRVGPLDLELSQTAGVMFFALRNREVPGGPARPFAHGPVPPQMAAELARISRRMRELGLHRGAAS